jgi:hypothetical protein
MYGKKTEAYALNWSCKNVLGTTIKIQRVPTAHAFNCEICKKNHNFIHYHQAGAWHFSFAARKITFVAFVNRRPHLPHPPMS